MAADLRTRLQAFHEFAAWEAKHPSFLPAIIWGEPRATIDIDVTV